MTPRCMHCGARLASEARFCFRCGRPTDTPSKTEDRPGRASPTHIRESRGPVLSGTFHGPVAETIVQTVDSTDPAALRAAYLGRLRRESERLPLRGVDASEADPSRVRQQRLGLAQIYVQLNTKTQLPLSFLQALRAGQPPPGPDSLRRDALVAPEGEEERRPISALEATIANRRLVLLGDPGSGKSTFVNHLALCLAGAALEPDRGWTDRLPGWPADERNLIPLPVVLRDFALWLESRPADPTQTRPAPARLLWEFIERGLADSGLAAYSRPLLDGLLKGSVLGLLDGLDEIPGKAERSLVRDAVADFGASFNQCRLLVTCRTLSYTNPAWQLPQQDYPTFELAPFSEEKIDRFIQAWYVELEHLGVVSRGDAEALAQRLRTAVRRVDLWRLAPNPLLLTVMALVHTHKGRLPEARALLYEDCVDLLLWRWEEMKHGQAPETGSGLRQLLLEADLQDVDLKRALWRIAFKAHGARSSQDREATADVSQADLLKALRALHPSESWDWAQAVVDQIKERAGLLIERRPEVYAFPHRTFQEYLAGCYLSARNDFANQAVALAAQDPIWREVILLAVGRLVHHTGDIDKPLVLAAELCLGQSLTADCIWRSTWLAGQVLVETGLTRVRQRTWGRELLARARRRLVALLDAGALIPLERANAANALARLGDPRSGVGTFARQAEGPAALPDILWCPVPAGPFKMGGIKMQRTVELPAYLISRYLITVAQFRAFIEDGGYRQAELWHEAAQNRVWRDGWVKAWRDEEPRDRPVGFGPPFNLPTHPIVGVTWYEALAFCRWLTNALRVTRHEPRVWVNGEIKGPEVLDESLAEALHRSSFIVRLLTEAEWEKAAQGVDGRLYPWGNAFDPARCNMGDTGIGSTSAVGIFPSGASPYGVLDLSGNVWEWCATRWQEEYLRPGGDEWSDAYLRSTAQRVLRGGAFYNGPGYMRCTVRYKHGPDLWGDFVGLRVALAPSPPNTG